MCIPTDGLAAWKATSCRVGAFSASVAADISGCASASVPQHATPPWWSQVHVSCPVTALQLREPPARLPQRLQRARAPATCRPLGNHRRQCLGADFAAPGGAQFCGKRVTQQQLQVQRRWLRGVEGTGSEAARLSAPAQPMWRLVAQHWQPLQQAHGRTPCWARLMLKCWNRRDSRRYPMWSSLQVLVVRVMFR